MISVITQRVIICVWKCQHNEVLQARRDSHIESWKNLVGVGQAASPQHSCWVNENKQWRSACIWFWGKEQEIPMAEGWQRREPQVESSRWIWSTCQLESSVQMLKISGLTQQVTDTWKEVDRDTQGKEEVILQWQETMEQWTPHPTPGCRALVLCSSSSPQDYPTLIPHQMASAWYFWAFRRISLPDGDELSNV